MLLIIDNYDSFTYNLYQLLASMGEEVEVVRSDRTTVSQVEASDPLGVVLSPGPGRPEDAGICIDLIRESSPRLPILGVCLGMQAMGVAYGGKVERSERPVHGKCSHVVHTGGGVLSGLNSPFMAARYHSLVLTHPGDLVVDGATEDGITMAVHHPYHARFGVQFHPESVLSPLGGPLLQNFVQICHSREYMDALQCVCGVDLENREGQCA